MTVGEILAVLSPLCAVAFGFFALRRNAKTDDTSSGREMGSILTELGYIKSSMDNLNRKFETHEERYTSLVERVAAIEQSTKSAHHRIDTLVKERIEE